MSVHFQTAEYDLDVLTNGQYRTFSLISFDASTSPLVTGDTLVCYTRSAPPIAYKDFEC